MRFQKYEKHVFIGPAVRKLKARKTSGIELWGVVMMMSINSLRPQNPRMSCLLLLIENDVHTKITIN